MIPYGRQSINEEDIAAVVSALKGEFLTTGPLVDRFEEELQNIVGAPCVSVSSGTAALHCAYFAIGLKPGDEVITPPMTFIATQATAAMFGATIVFADIQPDTGNIDPIEVERVISRRTKAIVAVDYAGHPADLDELRILADRHNIFLIEDAAHSIGSIYKGRKVGSIADLTTFSFFPTKNMTTTEGGAVASTNPELLLRARRFSRQGLVRESERFVLRNQGAWHQEIQEFGLNYRLPDVLCALGISQVRRIDEFKQKRTELHNLYAERLGNLENVILPKARDYVDPMWHLYPIRVPRDSRREVFEKFRNLGIGVQVNYLPGHWQPVFGSPGKSDPQLLKSENFYLSEISLPMWVSDSQWTDEYFSKIISALGGLE